MSQAVKEAISKAQLGAKYPAFTIIGHKKLSKDESFDFLLKNDTFLTRCFQNNYAGNTRGLSDLFNHEVGFPSFMKEAVAVAYPERNDDFPFSFGRFTLTDYLFKAMGHHAGRSLHLSCIQSSVFGRFSTWFNVETGEMRGWSGAYGKWVGSDEVYTDLLHIATHCPYVDMTVTQWDAPSYSDENLKPVISVRIKDGQLTVVDLVETEPESFYAHEIYPDVHLMPEIGVSKAVFEKFKQAIKNEIATHKEKALAMMVEPEQEEDAE